MTACGQRMPILSKRLCSRTMLRLSSAGFKLAYWARSCCLACLLGRSNRLAAGRACVGDGRSSSPWRRRVLADELHHRLKEVAVQTQVRIEFIQQPQWAAALVARIADGAAHHR